MVHWTTELAWRRKDHVSGVIVRVIRGSLSSSSVCESDAGLSGLSDLGIALLPYCINKFSVTIAGSRGMTHHTWDFAGPNQY